MKFTIFFAAIAILLTAPSNTFAQYSCFQGSCAPDQNGSFTRIQDCQDSCANGLCAKGFKPACNFNDLCKTYGFLINLASFGAAALTLVMFLYGSFKYVTASGAEEALATARKVITNAAIGLVLVSISYILMRIILTVTGQTVVCF